MSVAGAVLAGLGALVLLLAAIGLFTLPDALSRQHAATKAGALGTVAVVAGAALIGGDAGWAWRAALIVPIVWATMPVASHVLARAALREQGMVDPPARVYGDGAAGGQSGTADSEGRQQT